jgi:predicted transcriptional regulator
MLTLQIENPTLENSLKELAENLHIDTKAILERALKEFVISQEIKKANEIAENVQTALIETKKAHKKGESFQSLDEFLDEL